VGPCCRCFGSVAISGRNVGGGMHERNGGMVPLFWRWWCGGRDAEAMGNRGGGIVALCVDAYSQCLIVLEINMIRKSRVLKSKRLIKIY
jgi:hypothetical protein